VRIFKDLIVAGLAVLAGIYLMNPTLGFFEFLPDALPGVGNLDEATATLIIVNAFRYFGFDITGLFRREGLPGKQREANER